VQSERLEDGKNHSRQEKSAQSPGLGAVGLARDSDGRAPTAETDTHAQGGPVLSSFHPLLLHDPSESDLELPLCQKYLNPFPLTRPLNRLTASVTVVHPSIVPFEGNLHFGRPSGVSSLKRGY
jgi:hypothetical protein